MRPNNNKKLEDGNIRAAVRIVCSDEKPALNNDATLDALRQRHPPASANRNPSTFNAVSVTGHDVIKAIRSFPAGSAAGPDWHTPAASVRPHHLQGGRTGTRIYDNCTSKPSLLEDKCPPEVATVLFGGRLFALQKKSGEVRPIAIGR